MQKIFLLLFTSLILSTAAVSQPRLELNPREISFEDVFNRLENVYFKNIGNQTLIIDSLSYNNDYYFVRFNGQSNYPLFIAPGDSLLMDCIFSGYYVVPSADTSDTLFVYNNGDDPVEDLEIDIGYFDDDYGEGIINGQVTDGQNPLQGVKIHFLYAGTYVINSVFTDQFGFYSSILPPGNYSIAAEKDSFYVSFYDRFFDPFNAAQVLVQDDSLRTANLVLERMTETGYSISGSIYDSISTYPLKKGIVVVRKGTHTPGKIINRDSPSVVDEGIYTAFVKPDGTYRVLNIIQPDYYFVQSFSDYFVPTYYSAVNISPPFWQQADSLLINTQLSSRHIGMPRDSSFGGGTAIGTVTVNQLSASVPSDVVLYAKNVNPNSSIFNYVFSQQDGSFSLPFLPYGSYQLVAQRIGYDDAVSNEFIIDSLNTLILGVNLNFVVSDVDDGFTIPENVELYQNYPNPFNPFTNIEFVLPENEMVNLSISNILGEEVTALYNGYLNSGKHKFTFNGKGLSSGVYFVSLQTSEIRFVKKIILLK